MIIMKENLFIKKNIARMQMEDFLRQEFADGKIGDIEMQHTPVGTRVIIHTLTPGYVIGSDGSKVREVTEKIRQKFDIENPQIDVQKIEQPDLDPNIVAQNLAAGILDNVNVKKLGNQALERIMRSGALGCEIVFSGKLSGARSRRERFMAGYLKKCGETSERLVRTGTSIAIPKLGIISVRVKIMVNKLPDIIDKSKIPAMAIADVKEEKSEKTKKKSKKKDSENESNKKSEEESVEEETVPEVVIDVSADSNNDAEEESE